MSSSTTTGPAASRLAVGVCVVGVVGMSAVTGTAAIAAAAAAAAVVVMRRQSVRE